MNKLKSKYKHLGLESHRSDSEPAMTSRTLDLQASTDTEVKNTLPRAAERAHIRAAMIREYEIQYEAEEELEPKKASSIFCYMIEILFKICINSEAGEIEFLNFSCFQ